VPPASRTVGGTKLWQLRQMSPADFDGAEDSDGEGVVMCRQCRLPLGDFECSGKDKRSTRVHGECLAQLMLQSLQEEAEARKQEEALLKCTRRAEYEIGWRTETHSPGLGPGEGGDRPTSA